MKLKLTQGLVAVAAVAASNAFAVTSVSAKVGGVRVTASDGRTYYKATGVTEVTYRNDFLSDDAKVFLEIGYSGREMTLDGQMKDPDWAEKEAIEMTRAADGTYTATRENVRHVLGGRWKAYGASFVFRVELPQGRTVYDRCGDGDEKHYDIRFPHISDLPWKQANTPVVLARTGVDCRG